MSFILDALKRAEHERALGRPPEPSEVALSPAPVAAGAGPSRALIAILAAALLVAAIVIATLLMTRQRGPVAAADSTPPPEMQAAPATASAAMAAPVAAPPAIAATAPISSLDDLAKSDDPSASAAAEAQTSIAVRRPLSPSNFAQHPPQRAALPPASMDEAPPASGGREEAEDARSPILPPPQSDAGPAALSQPAPDPLSGAGAAAASLREMPSGYRDQFPTFSIDVHVYNDDPRKRFVVIDGKTYHEGDTLAQGPRIAAIVPEGLALDWQGQRVLYALNH